jgi:hypothetical protein
MKPKNFCGRKNLRRFGKKSVFNTPTITDKRLRIGNKNRDSTGLPKQGCYAHFKKLIQQNDKI